MRMTTSSLLNVLAPITAPAASHHRPSSRSTARIANSSAAGHTTRSTLDVSSTCPNSSVRVAPAIPHAVKACAEPGTADLSRDQRQEPDGCRGADDCAHPECHNGVSEQRDRRVREQRRERRLVGVAPRGRQHPEVQLVAMVPVQRREHREHEDERQSRRDDMAQGERMPLHGRARRWRDHGHRVAAGSHIGASSTG